MGLFKEDGDHQLEASRKTSSSPMSAQQEHQQVRRKFLNMR